MQTKKCDLNKIWNSIEIELLTDDNEVSFESWAGAASAAAPITLSSLSFSGRSAVAWAASKPRRFASASIQLFSANQQLLSSALPPDATVDGPLSISSLFSILFYFF